jgi:predicted transcriptional regulator
LKRAKNRKLGITKGAVNMFEAFIVKKKKVEPPAVAEGPKSRFLSFAPQKDMMIAKEVRGAASSLSLGDVERLSAGTAPPIEELRKSVFQQWRTAMEVARARTEAPPAPVLSGTAATDTRSGGGAAEPSTEEGGDEDGHGDDEDGGDGSNIRMKLLKFHTDVRPEYYGTYGKRSRVITGRRPCAMDTNLFDYEYDSEVEWEPEDCESGDECISGDELDEEDEKAKAEEAAGAEEDWLVPHGYLSDDEVEENEEQEDGEDGEDGEGGEGGAGSDRKESAKRQRVELSKKKKGVIKKYTVGCKWGDDAIQHPKLGRYAMAPLVLMPIDAREAPPVKETASKAAVRSKVPAEAFPDLIRLVHGTMSGTEQLAVELMAAHPELTKAACLRTIKSSKFCVKQLREPYRRHRRFVQPDVLEAYGLTNLPLPEPLPVVVKEKLGPAEVPEEAFPDLIRLVHGARRGTDQLAAVFMETHTDVVKAAVVRTIKDAAFSVKEQRPPYRRARRFVLPEMLAKFDLTDLPLPDPSISLMKQGKASIALEQSNILTAFETQNTSTFPWSRHYDGKSGVSYYFNETTKESTWNRPAELN